MGQDEKERLRFMQSIKAKLEEEYQKEIKLWKPKEINAFLEKLKSKIVDQCRKQQIHSSVDNIYDIKVKVKVIDNTSSFQPRSKEYVYSFPSSFNVRMFQRHFKEGKTGFRDYTCDRYATYFNYPTWKAFLYRDEPQHSFEEFIDWEELLSSIYLNQTRFTTIPIIGSEILELNKLSMGEYFGEISYTPLNVLHQKEMLLYKEKHQRKNYKNYVEALRNDEFLSQKNLQDFNRILILGNPGTGKTIYSRWLCHQWASGQITSGVLPVHIELKGVDFDLDQPLLHYVKTVFEKQFDQVIGAFAFSKENISRFFFILDGFDEILPKQQETLLTLLGIQQGIKYMLLSRPYAILGHEDHLEVDAIFELLGFGTNSQKLYTEKVLASNGLKFDVEDFWQLTNKHPFLSEFLSTPLTLSYLLILFIEQKKYDSSISLATVNSTYVLQQQVLYSLRRHFEEKATKKKLHIQHLQSFDDAIFNGSKLAYFMEKKLVFVVTYNDWDVSGGYTAILNLNEVGLGRLEFITKEKKKYLRREKGGRFSFITATIQEYLAASYFVKQFNTQQYNGQTDFLMFFSNNVSWNFCKMIIGKCVVDKEYTFLRSIKKILFLNKQQNPNVNNLYRYLLFFSELDAELLKKELVFEELLSSFEESMQVTTQRPIWDLLIRTVWEKIFLKIPRNLSSSFNNFYCAYSQQLLDELLSKDKLDTEVLLNLQTLINLGNVPSINQDEKVVNTIIDWVLQLNDVIIAMDFRIYGDPSLNEKLRLFVYRLEELADHYIALIEEGGTRATLLVYKKVKQVLSVQWKPFQPTVKALLEIIVLKSDKLSILDLLEKLKMGIEGNINLDHIRFLLEALEWKLKIQSMIYDKSSMRNDSIKINDKELVAILRRILDQYYLNLLDAEPETGIKTNTIQAIVALINHIPSDESYTLLFDMISGAFSFPERFQMTGVNYHEVLDLYVKNIIGDYYEQDKYALQFLVWQIVDIDEESPSNKDPYSLEEIEYINELEASLRGTPGSNGEIKAQIFPFEIIEKQLSIVLDLVKVLYYLDIGTILFFKNRNFFIESFEAIVFRNWCVVSEYLYVFSEENVSMSIYHQYLWYFRQLIFRTDFYDRKFLINKLLSSEVSKHPLVQKEFILCLLYEEMPLHEKKYWDFLLSIKEGDRDLEAIINVLCNNGIYIFKGNIKYLQNIWTWFEEYTLEDVYILEEDSEIYNPYNIFALIAITLKYILTQKLESHKSALLIINTMAKLLKRKDFQESMTFLEAAGDFQNQTYHIITYLLIIQFKPQCFSATLKEYLDKGNYDRETIFSFLMSLSEDRTDYLYLDQIVGKLFYNDLEEFYDYYEDIKIDSKLIPFE